MITKPPITTRQLVEYAGASGDFNRIHYDDAFAKEGGFPGVIAHGMLSMAFMAEAAAKFVGDDPTKVLKLTTKFKAVTYPGDVITVEIEPATRSAKGTMLLQMKCKKQDGTVTLEGEALVQVD